MVSNAQSSTENIPVTVHNFFVGLRVCLIVAYLSNTLTNLCIGLYCILLYCVVLNCIVLFIYCYVDIIQYNAMHKFVGVLDNPLLWYDKH